VWRLIKNSRGAQRRWAIGLGLGSLGLTFQCAVVLAQIAQSPVVPPGVDNPQRAWQHWTLNCQGCHRPDGTGSAGTAPSLAGTVAEFLWAPGGREYLCRVPGVATSALSDADLAEVLNWMMWRFDAAHLRADFLPFTAEELKKWRGRPLRLEASAMRADLLGKAETAIANPGHNNLDSRP